MAGTHVFVQKITEGALRGESISRVQARRILQLREQTDIMYLLAHANMVRQQFHGDHIDRCAIINARSGRCSEDCTFCAQSAHHAATVRTYGLVRHDTILRAARAAAQKHIHRFSIVTSGRGMTSPQALARICRAVSAVEQEGALTPCASLGILTAEQMQALRDAGLTRYHHNLETARSFFSRMCTTHTYAERVQTIRFAQQCGMAVCAGGIFGLGETPEQRIELAFALRDLDVDSVPLNFLSPIPGTPLQHAPPIEPLEALKIIALFRFVLPQKDIRICGGRERALRTLQPLMYLAGASGVMVGNYLTTSGRSAAIDLDEIHALGFK